MFFSNQNNIFTILQVPGHPYPAGHGLHFQDNCAGRCGGGEPLPLREVRLRVQEEAVSELVSFGSKNELWHFVAVENFDVTALE